MLKTILALTLLLTTTSCFAKNEIYIWNNSNTDIQVKNVNCEPTKQCEPVFYQNIAKNSVQSFDLPFDPINSLAIVTGVYVNGDLKSDFPYQTCAAQRHNNYDQTIIILIRPDNVAVCQKAIGGSK